MNSDADLFHEATSLWRLGGRVDPNKETWAEREIEFTRQNGERWIRATQSHYPNMPHVHLDFINSTTPNAIAFQYKGRYFVGVTLGVVPGIACLFRRMLSHRRVLTDIGDPENETDHKNLTVPFIESILIDEKSNGPAIIKCPHRNEQWNLLCGYAFYFLFQHEMIHILSGHVDYLSVQRNAPFLAEAVPGILSAQDSLEQHMMEIEADTGPVQSFIQEIMDKCRDPVTNAPNLDDFYEKLFWYLFAVFSFFRTFGDEPLSGLDLHEGTHPRFRARVANVVSAVITTGCYHLKLPIEELTTVFGDAAYAAETSFHVLTGDPVPSYERYIEGLDSDEARAYRIRLAEHWEGGFRQKLQDHAYKPVMICEDPPVDV